AGPERPPPPRGARRSRGRPRGRSRCGAHRRQLRAARLDRGRGRDPSGLGRTAARDALDCRVKGPSTSSPYPTALLTSPPAPTYRRTRAATTLVTACPPEAPPRTGSDREQLHSARAKPWGSGAKRVEDCEQHPSPC